MDAKRVVADGTERTPVASRPARTFETEAGAVDRIKGNELNVPPRLASRLIRQA